MITIDAYEARHADRLRHLADRWRKRNDARPALLPEGARLQTGPLNEEQRREVTEILNAVEQAEMWSSIGATILFGPVRHLFSPVGRELLDLFVGDERYHSKLFGSLRRALGLPARPFSNAVFGITLDAVQAYIVRPLLSDEPAQGYARGLLLLTLISEFLGDPIIEALTQRLGVLIQDPTTREIVGKCGELVAREERYHKAWPMIYRDLLTEDMRPEIVANHLKFFFLLIEDNPTYSSYLGKSYPEYFGRILRDKLGITLSEEQVQGIRGRISTLRGNYLRRKSRFGALPAFLMEKREVAAWKDEFAATLRRMPQAASA